MNDLEIRELQQRILNELNKAECPLEVKRLVVAEIYGNLVTATRNVIESQLAERNAPAEPSEETEE